MEHVLIVGPGRMGLALASALRLHGGAERITCFGRGLEPPPHPLFEPLQETDDDDDVASIHYALLGSPVPADVTILILAVPDRALSEVAVDLAATGFAPAGAAALHLSGALSTDVLEPLHARGYAVGSMHPLMAVADPWLGGDRLAGAAFALAGEPAAIAAARRVVHALGGKPLVIPPTLRPLYHAAAVMASNYLVAVTAAAVRVMAQAGVEEQEGLQALLPLMRGTLENVAHLGLPAALTGPIPRGDADTVRLHLARLSGAERALYCSLGLELLQLARAAGLDEERAGTIESLLSAG